jgi:hypothetical protein
MMGRLKSPALRCRSNQDDAGFWTSLSTSAGRAMPLGDNVAGIHMQNLARTCPRDMPADDRENGSVR